jgi:hypothetical protein
MKAMADAHFVRSGDSLLISFITYPHMIHDVLLEKAQYAIFTYFMKTDVSKKNIASITRVKRISELGKTLSVSVVKLLVTTIVVPIWLIIFSLMEAIYSSETSVLTRATQRRI